MAWIVVPALEELREQLDEVAPGRDKTSDGSIGDASHAAGRSSHNPDRTGNPEHRDGDAADEIRARDFDRDLRTPGLTMLDIVQHLVVGARAGRFWWLRYIIFDGVIYHRSTGWQARAYTGVNKHREHAHVNSDFTQAADTVRGIDYHLEDLVSLSTADLDKIRSVVRVETLALAKTVRDEVADAPKQLMAYPIKLPDGRTVDLYTLLRWLDPAQVDTRNKILAAISVLAGKDFTDEQAIVSGVLGGLDPAVIAAAIPATVAQQVVDELVTRLEN